MCPCASIFCIITIFTNVQQSEVGLYNEYNLRFSSDDEDVDVLVNKTTEEAVDNIKPTKKSKKGKKKKNDDWYVGAISYRY